MTWMQRFACELEKGRDHAFAWLLNAVMRPWRDAGVAHFQQKCSRGFVSENAHIQHLDRIPGGKPLHTFPECGLAHFQQKCSRGFVSENAQFQTFSASNPTKSGSDFVDDALAKDLLANAFALKEYRWMVRFAEEMLRGVIRAHAAGIKFYEVNPPEPVRSRSIPKIPKIPPIKPIRGDFYFRMRDGEKRPSLQGQEGGRQGRMRANGPRKSPDLTLTGLRLMLRAQAVEAALHQAKRYAWRYARAQAAKSASRGSGVENVPHDGRCGAAARHHRLSPRQFSGCEAFLGDLVRRGVEFVHIGFVQDRHCNTIAHHGDLSAGDRVAVG